MADLTPDRLANLHHIAAELRRIAAETTPGTYEWRIIEKEGPRMPDVPKRCPYCNSGDRREDTWRGSPAYSFSCGTVFYANGEVALRYLSCYAREKEREERAIREQLTSARTEAERYRQQYEKLYQRTRELERRLAYYEPDMYIKRCTQCDGRGRIEYPDTNTWRRGGFAGQAITIDVCDRCWGTGDEAKPGTNLRQMLQQLGSARAEAELWKQRYEFLRSEMERLVQELRQLAHLFAKDWLETDDLYYEGASDAYYFAEKMARRVLSDAGGGDQ